MSAPINKNKMAVIKKLMQMENLMAVFCIGTNMPLVECNPETYNDQVFVFESEELMKEFAVPYFQKKKPLRGVVFPSQERMKYFNTLLCMNVDELVFVEKEGRHVITLSDFIKKQDFSDRPKEQRPIENPQLQLSGIYFMQEASRPVPNEEKEGISELEEELAANMVKATYILPIEFLEGEETEAEKLKTNRFRIPIIKTDKGDVFQPVFTDNIELSKYNREGKFKCLAVPFANLEKIIVPEAKAYMLNPNGFHILMPRELLKGLKIRFGIEGDAPVK